MEVHLPSSCAAASSDLTVCGFYSLILLLIPLLLIISRWQFNSLTRPMAGNCWPDSAWSIIVHLLIHIHHSLTHYLTASSSSLSVNWVVLSGLSSSSFPGPGKVLTWVHYFYAIHRLRIVRIRILLSWTTHSSQPASQPAVPNTHSSRWSWLWKNPTKLAKAIKLPKKESKIKKKSTKSFVR